MPTVSTPWATELVYVLLVGGARLQHDGFLPDKPGVGGSGGGGAAGVDVGWLGGCWREMRDVLHRVRKWGHWGSSRAGPHHLMVDATGASRKRGWHSHSVSKNADSRRAWCWRSRENAALSVQAWSRQLFDQTLHHPARQCLNDSASFSSLFFLPHQELDDFLLGIRVSQISRTAWHQLWLLYFWGNPDVAACNGVFTQGGCVDGGQKTFQMFDFGSIPIPILNLKQI